MFEKDAHAKYGGTPNRLRARHVYPASGNVQTYRVHNNQPTGGRVVLSALGPRPIEVSNISESIAKSEHEEAAEIAWSQAFPMPTHQWSTPWRKKMVRVEVGRALAELS